MLQRIQTIFLFLIAVAMGIAMTTTIWEKFGIDVTESARLTTVQLTYKKGGATFITPAYYLSILTIVVGAVSLLAVFKYQNRLLQMGLCAVNAILLTIIMGLVLYLTLYKGKEYFNPTDQGNFGIGFYAFVAALLFNMLANRYIRRDEKLVRDSDRLR